MKNKKVGRVLFFASSAKRSPHSLFLFCDSTTAMLNGSYPTGPFTIFELQDQENGKFHVLLEHRPTDFAALKLWKGQPGSGCIGRGMEAK